MIIAVLNHAFPFKVPESFLSFKPWTLTPAAVVEHKINVIKQNKPVVALWIMIPLSVMEH